MWVAENLQRRELELDPDAKFLARHCAALWRFECVPSPSLTQNLSRWDQGDTTFKTPDPRILDSSQEFDILLGKPFLQRSMISRRINLEYFDDIKGYVDERFGNNGGLPSFIPFIAGTLADGGSLLDYWKRGNEKPRSLEPILWSLRQMCSLAGALYSLHHEHCRHGDLKPANILRLEEDSDRESSRIKLSRECSTLKDETAQQYEIGLLNDSEWKREVQSARANLKVQHQYFRLPSSSVLKDFARLVTNQVNKFRSLLLQLQFQSLTRKRSSSGVMQFGKTGLLSVLSWVSPVTATSVGTGNHSCASFLTALHHELHELRRVSSPLCN
jgi:serine/threonine protein kinase